MTTDPTAWLLAAAALDALAAVALLARIALGAPAYRVMGAGVIPRLPFAVPVPVAISAVYLLRAAAFPLLKSVFPGNRATFWWASSAVCAALGGVHAVGTRLAWSAL